MFYILYIFFNFVNYFFNFFFLIIFLIFIWIIDIMVKIIVISYFKLFKIVKLKVFLKIGINSIIVIKNVEVKNEIKRNGFLLLFLLNIEFVFECWLNVCNICENVNI